MIKLNHIRKVRQNRIILDDIDFSLKINNTMLFLEKAVVGKQHF